MSCFSDKLHQLIQIYRQMNSLPRILQIIHKLFKIQLSNKLFCHQISLRCCEFSPLCPHETYEDGAKNYGKASATNCTHLPLHPMMRMHLRGGMTPL